jgi:hypothetical protein
LEHIAFPTDCSKSQRAWNMAPTVSNQRHNNMFLSLLVITVEQGMDKNGFTTEETFKVFNIRK